MPQINVNNLDTLDQLRNDANFRKEFLKNTESLLALEGNPVSAKDLNTAVEKQLKGLSRLPAGAVARTAVIITVF